MMTPGYKRYVYNHKTTAIDRGLDWDIVPDGTGKVSKTASWSFNDMLGVPAPPANFLSDMGSDKKTLAILNGYGALGAASLMTNKASLSRAWQDLIKAVAIEHAFVRKSSPAHISGGVLRPLRVLATCSLGKEPWSVSAEDVARAMDIASQLQKSGQLRQLIEVIVRDIFDDNQIAERHPLLSGKRLTRERTKGTANIRATLEERKRAERLPEAKAFWELVRIIHQETPQSFLDAMRFEMVKLMIFLGLRGNEIATLPLDWRRTREYFDPYGNRADTIGGIGRSIQIRHFAEKQKASDQRGIILYQNIVDIPPLFEEVVVQSLERISELTAPLRSRLRLQCETGRSFPEFGPDHLITIEALYPRLTGEPFLKNDPDEVELTSSYIDRLDTSVLEKILRRQDPIHHSKLKNKVRQYFARMANAAGGTLPYRDPRFSDKVVPRKGYWRKGLFRVGDIEALVQQIMPTKLSDTTPFNVEGGASLQPHECLFLAPKRAINEARNGGVCDVLRYAFVGRLTLNDVTYALSKDSSDGKPTIFERYAHSAEDRALSIRPHDLRHLMNTELFRQGVADTIISKRFNRKSVAQSYEYDHRSLAEDLDRIDIPEGLEPLLFGKAKQVFQLIQAGHGHGPIVRQFKSIQKQEGDEAAIVYLAAEADGFHLTPYGGCLNSFVAEPCPNHLECFNNCRHLMRIGLPGEDAHLEKLLQRYATLVTSIEGHPASDGAKRNMQAHAEERMAAIRKTLTTSNGQLVFPEGEDRSLTIKTQFRGPFRAEQR